MFIELHPSVVTTAKSRAQQGIASIRHRTDHRRDGAVVEVRPERPGFLEIAEHDLPRLRPTRTDGFLERVNQFAECGDVSCGVLRILCHFDDGGGLILGVTLRDEIGLGIGAGDLLQGLGQHLSGQPLTLSQGLTERSVLRNDGVDVRAEVLGGALQGVLEQFAAHTGINHRVPVHQRDSTGGDGLRELIHGRSGLRSRRARCSRQVGDTLDRGDGRIQIHTGSGERADVLGHLGEVVDGLIGVGVQFRQRRIDLIQRGSLGSGVRQDGLDRVHLELVLAQTTGYALGEHRCDVLTDIGDFSADGGQRAERHGLKSREALTDGANALHA